MDVAIVVPCYNESERWHTDYWRSMFAVPGVTWLFVDDGSTDATGDLLDRTAIHSDAAVLRLSPNGGKAEAVRRGLLAVLDMPEEFTAVGYMDADGAFRSEDVAAMCEVFRERAHSGQCDAVWSARVALSGRDIRRSSTRHYIGRTIATFVSIGQREIPYDTQSGFKLFAPSPTLAACLATPFQTRWLFELELLNRWRRVSGSALSVWEEPLHHWTDVPGSKLNPRAAGRVARELIHVKVDQWRTTRRARS